MALLRRLCKVTMCLMVVVCFERSSRAFELTILHTNDIHARFDQTDSRSGECSESEAAKNECYGGYPRLIHKVNELRTQYSNVVVVDAGDQFQGTIWFYTYGGNITAHFMNTLQYDIMALGNHEFDLGPSELERFVSQTTFLVLSSNVDASHYPGLQRQLAGSHVLEIGGQKVGFVGYTTVDTVNISSPEEVKFSDEVEAVRREVRNLTNQGVDKIVCVGHAGFLKDQQIAREVLGVDVVVGGHTNTFLYTGDAPSNEKPVGEYPQVVTQGSWGDKALVVQDYAFGKYLGFLQVTFDDNGAVTSWSGNPILLNSSIPRDQSAMKDLAEWRKGVTRLTNQTVGTSAVLLEGNRKVCRLAECNLGNLITDAMVMQNLRHSDGEEWNHVAIAIVNSGGIRTSLGKGGITIGDVLTVHPFRSTIDIIEIKGSTFKPILEHSASQWNPENTRGGFLQHSGLHVVYDMTRPVGSRVLDIQVKCADCQIPSFEPVDDNKVYKVIINSFLVGGGDGYDVIKNNILKHHLNGDLDSDVLTEYISKFSPLTQGLEGRIRLGDPCKGNTSGAGPANLTSLSLLILVALLVRGLSVFV